VSAATPGLSLSANDTAAFETPAIRATSVMVVGDVDIVLILNRFRVDVSIERRKTDI
jgi:hypothetical protein